MRNVYKTHVRNSGKAACAFNNTVLPPYLCNPGLYSGGGREGARKVKCVWSEVVMVKLIVPADRRGSRSNSARAAVECRNSVFRCDWLWCISWQGLEGSSQ